MAEATAWIVQLSDGLYAAVGERQMVHLVEEPILEPVPYTPVHCRHIILWEGELLPVIDLTAWLTDQATEPAQASICVVSWQEHPDTAPQYGALLFAGIPRKLQVSDHHACSLPTQPAGWQAIALSSFHHDDQPVVILDLPRIFSDALVTGHEAPRRTYQGNMHPVQPLTAPEVF